MNHELLTRFRKIQNLPTIDGVAYQFLEACVNKDLSLDHLADILKPDPALTAKLIFYANVASIGGHSSTSVAEALAKLGLDQARFLALSFSLLRQSQIEDHPTFNPAVFWIRSLLFVDLLLDHVSNDPQFSKFKPPTLFTFGLLSHIGFLSLYLNHKESLDPSFHLSHADRLSFEEHQFSIHSDDLSYCLLTEWGFPHELCSILTDSTHKIHHSFHLLWHETLNLLLEIQSFISEHTSSPPNLLKSPLLVTYPHLSQSFSLIQEYELLTKIPLSFYLNRIPSKPAPTLSSSPRILSLLKNTSCLKLLGQFSSSQDFLFHIIRHPDDIINDIIFFRPDVIYFDLSISTETIRQIKLQFPAVWIFVFASESQIKHHFSLLGECIDLFLPLDPVSPSQIFSSCLFLKFLRDQTSPASNQSVLTAPPSCPSSNQLISLLKNHQISFSYSYGVYLKTSTLLESPNPSSLESTHQLSPSSQSSPAYSHLFLNLILSSKSSNPFFYDPSGPVSLFMDPFRQKLNSNQYIILDQRLYSPDDFLLRINLSFNCNVNTIILLQSISPDFFTLLNTCSCPIHLGIFLSSGTTAEWIEFLLKTIPYQQISFFNIQSLDQWKWSKQYKPHAIFGPWIQPQLLSHL